MSLFSTFKSVAGILIAASTAVVGMTAPGFAKEQTIIIEEDEGPVPEEVYVLEAEEEEEYPVEEKVYVLEEEEEVYVQEDDFSLE